MAVTREEAVYAYRLILGREPESETVIEHAMAASDVAHLRAAFLGSAEFVRMRGERNSGLLPVGRFLEVEDLDVDTRCTDVQLQSMFDRIAACWRNFGDTEPHWSVLTNDDFRQENLADHIESFYASGRSDIDIHLHFLRRSGLPTSHARAIDFGCGVGRLTLSLAPYAQEVVGIDVSRPHLDLAIQRAQKTGISNVRFDAIDAVGDLNRYRDFNLIISRIVLQHNPPPVIAEIYRKLLNALSPAGVAIVQIPTYVRGQSFAAESYLSTDQPSMEMNALPQKLIFEIIEQAGCRAFEVREDSAAGDFGLSHTFAVQRIR